jgi:hypothetical protein
VNDGRSAGKASSFNDFYKVPELSKLHKPI